MVLIQLDINNFRLEAPVANIFKKGLHSLQILTRDQPVCCHCGMLHAKGDFIY